MSSESHLILLALTVFKGLGGEGYQENSDTYLTVSEGLGGIMGTVKLT